MSKKKPTEAEINYRYVGSASKSIHKSVKQASRNLTEDYERILQTYTEKGGFSSRQEALDYLNGHVQPEGYKALVDRARKLPEPYRTQELTKLSTDAYKFRLSRTKACDIAQGYHARMLREDIRKDLGQAKENTAITASEQTLYNAQKATGSTGIGFDLPNTGQIKQIAYGTSTEKKIKLFSDNEMKEIRGVMDAGILSGRSYEQVAKDCERFTDNEFYKVRRLVRTEMAQASVDAERAEMEELGYEEYEVHCTLDEKTCEICGSHDGKVYKMGDETNMPTYHPNCRCYITPVTKKEGRTRSARGLERNKQGKSIKIPADMTYPEWAEKYGSERAQRNLSEYAEPDITPVPNPVMKPETIAGVLPSREMSVEMADEGHSNPDYEWGTNYANNCQTCVLAYAMRLRGYDVVAKPKSTKLQRKLARDGTYAWIDKKTGVCPKYEKCAVKDAIGLEDWMSANAPIGSKYTLGFRLKGVDFSHVMVIEKTKDGLRLVETQIGKHVEDPIKIRHILENIDYDAKNSPRLLRFDDKCPNPKVMNVVLKRSR